MKDSLTLDGKLVLVTGGTRGIGRAISLRLSRAGAVVVANYARNEEAAESLVEEATEGGLELETCRGDLTAGKGLDAVEQAVDSRMDELSLSLVHCAATGVHRPVEELTGRFLDFTFALNVRAFLELVHRLLPRMAQGSAIVTLSSEGAQRAVPQYSLVGASKGAVESLSRHFAAELAPRGIRVNVVSPGTVNTGAWDALPKKDVRLADAARRSPCGRLTTPEEVASATHFLLSDAASGIIGHTLVVDGGKRIVE